jgi:hypothetical protein
MSSDFPKHGVLLLVIPAFCTKSDYLGHSTRSSTGLASYAKDFFSINLNFLFERSVPGIGRSCPRRRRQNCSCNSNLPVVATSRILGAKFEKSEISLEAPRMARIQNLKPLGVPGGERLKGHGFETRSFADPFAACPHGFAFYLADPSRSVHGGIGVKNRANQKTKVSPLW